MELDYSVFIDIEEEEGNGKSRNDEEAAKQWFWITWRTARGRQVLVLYILIFWSHPADTKILPSARMHRSATPGSLKLCLRSNIILETARSRRSFCRKSSAEALNITAQKVGIVFDNYTLQDTLQHVMKMFKWRPSLLWFLADRSGAEIVAMLTKILADKFLWCSSINQAICSGLKIKLLALSGLEVRLL